MQILIAERHSLHQQFLKKLLSKWGHEVTLAGESAEAVATLRRRSFDVVLVDDSLLKQSTESPSNDDHLRKFLTEKGQVYITLTSDGTRDDNNCRQGECRGFAVSRPISPDRLRATLEEVRVSPTATSDSGGSAASVDPDIFDEAAALDRIEGDVEFLQELMEEFLAESDSVVERLRQSVSDQDAVSLRCVAHTLKSTVALFSASNAREASYRLEQLGEGGCLETAPQELEQLEAHLNELTDTLHNWLRRSNSALSPR